MNVSTIKRLGPGLIMGLLTLPATAVLADEATINTAMKQYQSAGAEAGNAQRGEALWNRTFSGKAPFTERSCKTCHSANVKNQGKHARTGKVIKPLAPSVNPNSFNKIKKVNKWFKRNCKWTLGQECSAQQKADILAFLKQQ